MWPGTGAAKQGVVRGVARQDVVSEGTAKWEWSDRDAARKGIVIVRQVAAWQMRDALRQ